ncbi:unnamed protein product [Dovyalis caffra]|uniref:Uncharacterized protein n=1 Tax=Dovyalis caffra TaxID=77055 RepID=A0AAV1S431_9ROSI|nr:unnamed protein product [Dovyalis caffra]
MMLSNNELLVYLFQDLFIYWDVEATPTFLGWSTIGHACRLQQANITKEEKHYRRLGILYDELWWLPTSMRAYYGRFSMPVRAYRTLS